MENQIKKQLSFIDKNFTLSDIKEISDKMKNSVKTIRNYTAGKIPDNGNGNRSLTILLDISKSILEKRKEEIENILKNWI